MTKEEKQGYQPICKRNQNRVTPPNTGSHVKMEEQEELLNSTLEENKEIYKKMADLDTALEDCTESLTDARIKIKELEEKISILLSCKNCPDNKGGYICQKEYEDKCLAQKIQYIKELKEENAELKKQQFSLKNERNTFLAQNEQYEKDLIDFNGNLTKAKEIIKKIEKIFYNGENALKRLSKISDIIAEAEQFLNNSDF